MGLRVSSNKEVLKNVDIIIMEITSSQKLALLFPKSNKVLSSILKNATPQQLETLSSAKDLKAILTQLTTQTLDTHKSNTIILEILKNSEFFKELGSFPKEMKVLIDLLAQSKAPNKAFSDSLEKLVKLLKNSLVDIKQSDVKSLQNFVKNSGVFLESKFIQEYTPKEVLKDALYELKEQLLVSEKSNAPKLIKLVQSLLENKTLLTKSTDATLIPIKKELDTLLSSLKSISKSTEPIYFKEVKNLIASLQEQVKSFSDKQDFSLSKFKNIISNISSELRISASPSTKALNVQLELIATKIDAIVERSSSLPLLKKLSLALQEIPSPQSPNKRDQEINLTSTKNPSASTLHLLESIKQTSTNKTFSLDIKETNNPLETKATKLEHKILDKLKTTDPLNTSKLDIKSPPSLEEIKKEVKTLSTMKLEDIELLKPEQVKVFFSSLSEQIKPLPSLSTKGIFETIEKILMILKQPSQDFAKENIPKEIKNWIASFDKELEKGDIVFSKSFQTQISKLKNFYSPSHSLDNKLLQENLQKDLKALLISLDKEFTTQPINNSTEVLKSLDKLLLQVDYFQLLSHLSNASYLYIPYTWEGLENGKFSFKSKEDGSCYCEIDLELKKYGSLTMMLQLFEDNQLNINIYTQDKELQALFKIHIKDLKEALINVNVMPRNIQIYTLKEHPKEHINYKTDTVLDELGFEVKG